MGVSEATHDMIGNTPRDTEPLLPTKSDYGPKLFQGAWENPNETDSKQLQFNAGVAVCVTAYGETEEEIANNLKTFQGEVTSRVHLSIMLDGHSSEESREASETYQAYSKLLIQPYGEGEVMEHGCIVHYGKLDNVPFRLYIKGKDLPRGQHNSHKLWYTVLDSRVTAGLEVMPAAFLHMDADTGSPQGVSDVERLLVLLLERDNVATVAPGVVPFNPWQNLVTAHQVLDMSCMKMWFCIESAFQASQVNMGMTYMTRAAHMTFRNHDNSYVALLDDYLYYDGDHCMDVVNPPTINQDVWSTYFAIRAGYGAMVTPTISFYTTPPDDWMTLMGQRRRWYSGTVLAAYQWLDPTSSPRNFFTFSHLRFLMWICVVPCYFYFLWCGLGLLAYNVGYNVTAFYCTFHNMDYVDAILDHPELKNVHEMAMLVFWAVVLVWGLGTVERDPKDMKIFANTFIYGTIAVTLAFYIIIPYSLYLGTNTHNQKMADTTPQDPFLQVDPIKALVAYALAFLLYPLLPHLFINKPSYWPTLACGYLVQLVTGSALFNYNVPQVHALFWVYSFNSLDSATWGVRDSSVSGIALSGVSKKYENQKFWRKIKKWLFFSTYLCVNIMISFAFVRVPDFAAIWWAPIIYTTLFFTQFSAWLVNWMLYVLILALMYNTYDCFNVVDQDYPGYARRAKEHREEEKQDMEKAITKDSTEEDA